MKNSSTDKPNAQRNGWKLLGTDYPYSHPMFRLRRDRLNLPNGSEGIFTYVEKGPAVFVIPITPEGEIVLIRQFRYVADRWSWEIPAGGSHDFDGEDLADLARRELWEEIGGTAKALRHLGTFCGASGVLSQTFHVYLAEDVQLSDQHLEATEVIEVHPMPLDRALELMRDGDADAFDAYVLLRYAPLLRALVSKANEPS